MIYPVKKDNNFSLEDVDETLNFRLGYQKTYLAKLFIGFESDEISIRSIPLRAKAKRITKLEHSYLIKHHYLIRPNLLITDRIKGILWQT